MKLSNQFSLWYLATSSVVLLLGGIIVFYSVEHEIVREESNRLKDSIELIAQQIKEGTPVEELDGGQVSIRELGVTQSQIPMRVVDTTAFYAPTQDWERELWASASYLIQDKHYLIKTTTFVGEPDEIAEGILISLGWTFLLLLAFVGLTSRLISRRLNAPFYTTLKAIQSFSLTEQKPLKLAATQTDEFQELNSFLERMTTLAVNDYIQLREFTENASHELQTPLAIIRGKLELLMDSPITDQQSQLILSAHNSVEKLSKINRSLTLLTKLEHSAYQTKQSVDLSKLVQENLELFEELIQIKSITLKTEVAEDVRVTINPAMADILLTNLLNNAIRHNREGGAMGVRLSSARLLIENTGLPPQVPTEQLFQRFKKSNQSSDSIGLGLAIVQQICDLNHFDIQYRYEEPWHRLVVDFYPVR